MQILSTLVSVSALFIAVSSAQCQNRVQTINGRTCKTTCGIDRPGGDYDRSHTDSFDGCVQACAADSRCVTAQYHRDNGFCYFKKTSNGAVSDKNDDTVDCGPKAQTTTTSSSKKSTMSTKITSKSTTVASTTSKSTTRSTTTTKMTTTTTITSTRTTTTSS